METFPHAWQNQKTFKKQQNNFLGLSICGLQGWGRSDGPPRAICTAKVGLFDFIGVIFPNHHATITFPALIQATTA